MANDVCALTGEIGQYVDAHILPKALTRPEMPGAPLIQRSSGKAPVRRWSSWYDPGLVTEKGEKILSDYDNWAIRELRKNKLVWSGWESATSLEASDYRPIPGTPWGFRNVTGLNTERLRMFFLSVMWRAAATGIPDFREVQLSQPVLAKLRAMVRDNDPAPMNFLPISLTQLSTLGVIHNHGVFAMQKEIPTLPGLPPSIRHIYRIYIDGLIAHVHTDNFKADHITELGNFTLGANDDLLLNTVTFENSFQLENMAWIRAESLPSKYD